MDPQQALKSIKTLAEVATETDDIEIMRKHFKMILEVADKAIKPTPRNSAYGQ